MCALESRPRCATTLFVVGVTYTGMLLGFVYTNAQQNPFFFKTKHRHDSYIFRSKYDRRFKTKIRDDSIKYKKKNLHITLLNHSPLPTEKKNTTDFSASISQQHAKAEFD